MRQVASTTLPYSLAASSPLQSVSRFFAYARTGQIRAMPHSVGWLRM
jgi:hypothetical protein